MCFRPFDRVGSDADWSRPRGALGCLGHHPTRPRQTHDLHREPDAGSEPKHITAPAGFLLTVYAQMHRAEPVVRGS